MSTSKELNFGFFERNFSQLMAYYLTTKNISCRHQNNRQTFLDFKDKLLKDEFKRRDKR